jgi:lipopolysaccharide export system permease protein
MLVAYAISLYLLPISYGKFRDMQTFLRNNYVSILLQEGVFSNPVDGLTVFIRERDKDGILHGILVHDNRDLQAPITMIAEQGRLVETPQGPRFLLTNGNRQEMQNGRLSFLTFESYTMDISLYAQGMKNRVPDTQEMFLPQLFAYDDSLPPSENQKRFAEAHQRLIWPAYSLVLALVALAVLLSGEFNRRGHWRRIAIAVICGIIVMFSAVGLRGMTATYAVMVPVAYLNLLAPACVALWLLADHTPRRIRRVMRLA